MADAVSPVEVIRKRLPELRRKRGLTAVQLGEAMAAAGIPWDRSIVANFESGRRESVTVVELLGLAYALGVSPVALMIPVEDEVPYQVLPGRVEPAGTARAWVRGAAPLPGMREVDFWAEVPEGEAGGWVPTVPLSETLSALQRDVAQIKRYVDFSGTMRPVRRPRGQESRDDG